MAEEAVPVLVRAKFNFNAKNNDELTFRKNEIITLTQQLEGGWWEGTLNGMTGWFPSNYVDVLENQPQMTNGNGNGGTGKSSAMNERKAFRAAVITDFTTTEKLYVEKLNETNEKYLLAVKEGLSAEDWQTLSFNFSSIVEFQSSVWNDLEKTLSLEFREQKVGGILLNHAAELKSLITDYCWNHPRAIEVINEKEEYISEKMTSLEKDKDEFLSRLSEPFRHLDRYPTFLQELERSMEEDHSDRGNVQRAYAIFKELKTSCEMTRKQKEAHMELFHSAPIEEWAPFCERGKILFVGIAQIKQGEFEKERCFAIFTKMVLVMEIAASNKYHLEMRIPSIGLVVRKQEGGFALTSSSMNMMISIADCDEWLKAFSQMEGVRVENNMVVTGRPPTPQHSRPPVVQMRREATPTSSAAAASDYTPVLRREKKPQQPQTIGELKLDHELGLLMPDAWDEVDSPNGGGIQRQKSFSLKPAPLQRCNSTGDAKKTVKMRKETPIVDPDDTVLLRIVEGYCGLSSSAKSTGPIWQQPQLIVAENEKILIEEVVGDEVIIQEKSLVDTVYSLRDQLANLQQEVAHITKCLDREQRSRRRLEDHLKRLSDHPPTSPRAASPRD